MGGSILPFVVFTDRSKLYPYLIVKRRTALGRYKTKKRPKQVKKSFPLWLIISGLALVGAAVIVLLSSSGNKKADIEVTGAPRLKVEQEVYDFGDVKLGGMPIRTVVKVTNVGDQPLRFKDAPYIEVLEGC